MTVTELLWLLIGTMIGYGINWLMVGRKRAKALTDLQAVANRAARRHRITIQLDSEADFIERILSDVADPSQAGPYLMNQLEARRGYLHVLAKKHRDPS